jgi:hypothetical protein
MELVAQLAVAIDVLEVAQFRIAEVAAPVVGYKDQIQELMERFLVTVSALGGAK